MTNSALARSYLRKAAVRLSLLPLLQRKGAYGDVDFIPTEEYGIEDGRRAIRAAKMAVQTARLVLRRSKSR